MNELFAPGKRHEEEERRRLEITLDEVGDADPGRGPIDLASGAVTIRVPPRPGADEDENGDADGDAGEHSAEHRAGHRAEHRDGPRDDPGGGA
ncbi:DUF6191 domain-containing protein [Streptomyces sp. NPDC051597]|uniref:DUF6191 domain-containing protein n=1 Tax=Streptomyces sp. NPDC051597 TaxID=3155049 RepID=UPI0034454A6B